MSNNPEQIRQDIETTRGRLSDDVDVLTETVRPSNVARRQADKVTGKAAAIKDRVMGTADDLQSQGSGAVSQLGDKASQMPQMARQRAQGNPLAAGLVALGTGWLVGSLLPASQKERQATGQLKDKAQPLVEEAKSVAQETAQGLKQPAQEAVESVKETATESAQTVKEEGRSTAQDVRSSATDAAETVKESRQQQ